MKFLIILNSGPKFLIESWRKKKKNMKEYFKPIKLVEYLPSELHGTSLIEMLYTLVLTLQVLERKTVS